jgi:hypothetical protein
MNPMEQRLIQIQRFVLWTSTLFPLAFVSFLLVARWPEYWKWINFEDTPMTSLEVAVMYTTALTAFIGGCFVWLRDEAGHRDWWLLAGAFFYFALDDRFAIHERIRDNLLAPRGIRVPFLPWIGPGDFILLVYALVGLALLPRLLRITLRNKPSMYRFAAAAAVAFIAVLLDTIDLNRLPVKWQRLEQTVEEILELIAQVLFFQSFFLAWFSRLRQRQSEAQNA